MASARRQRRPAAQGALALLAREVPAMTAVATGRRLQRQDAWNAGEGQDKHCRRRPRDGEGAHRAQRLPTGDHGRVVTWDTG